MALLLCLLLAVPSPDELFKDLRWRPVGPFRGGRTKAALGVPGAPGLFYMAAVNGGVWRSDDYGRTWTPIFDEQGTGSIGALAAPTPELIYAGSGEGLHRPDLSVGDGLYKSADGGRTWQHLGLRDAQQIAQIAVDPRDSARLFVAALGHPYGPSEERGLFRSSDGGKSFKKVLYLDERTGAADVVIDPANSTVVYAALWEAREAPWENGSFEGPGSALYKSVDGGETWKKIMNGLPDFEHDKVGRIGIGIAPSRTSRLFVTVAAHGSKGGLYRSDDAGESWTKICADERVAERADDFAEVKVHPLDPDTVFTASVVIWKSTDGGKNFTALKGAPGGDDYHRLWLDPARPDTMILGSDQGAAVSVNGGRTWSSWYNQPTAQLFHVTADDAFPYRLCGGQQESGSACVSSRGPDGAVTFRDWHPAGLEEYGYAAPDPRDPDVVYGGRISRWDRRTGQVQNLSPVLTESPDYRVIRTQPVVFSPLEKGTLFFASNNVWKTRDGGKSWEKLSPDLTRKTWELPATVQSYSSDETAKPKQRGVIYALAPSPRDARVIWAGTDDGLIHVTRDAGRTWKDVTPSVLQPWFKVSILEAGHFDAGTAWAAINTLRLDLLHPLILRTHDFGKSWESVAQGLPDGTVVNVVREDPARRGLLYAGTEQSVFASFDDGAHWMPLRLGLPATSVRDLIVKGDDLAIATHGRGFFILDQLAALRQLNDAVLAEPVHLFRPGVALRLRTNTNTDTPLPPDEPMAPNPPDGAVIEYLLAAPSEVKLELLDAAGAVVRSFSSADAAPAAADEGNIPRWWIRPPAVPAGTAGLHRFVWDLHEAPPPALTTGFSIAAVPHDTPREPRGPWVVPGRYSVRLSAAGKTLTQPLSVQLDPRVKAAPGALVQQHALARKLALAMKADFEALQALKAARVARPDNAELAKLEGQGAGRRRRRAAGEPPTFSSSNARLAELLGELEQSDAAPTRALSVAIDSALKDSAELQAKWTKVRDSGTPY